VNVWKRAGPAIGLVLAWVLFAALAGRDFAALENQRLMLLQTAVVGTAAVGATLILVSGGIDLSVGSTIALGTMTGAIALRAGASPGVAALAGVATGLAAGLAIGSMVVGRIAAAVGLGAGAFAGWRLGGLAGVALGAGIGAALGFAVARRARLPLSPFIVTLGMWGAIRGLAKGIGGNQPVYPPSPAGTGWLADLMLPGAVPGGIAVLVIVAALAAVLLRTTKLGRHALAVGSNEEAARLCGIDVERTKVLVYVLGVGCAGVASVLQLSYLSMGDPTTAQGAELRVIAAAVIGGASLSGGEGSILGTLLGALLMTVIDNGCTKLGLDNWVQECVTGAIIVAAVAVDRLRHRAER
jgi:ribose/xylose/arabinose/galactoside ABC-type transport system permease subunit